MASRVNRRQSGNNTVTWNFGLCNCSTRRRRFAVKKYFAQLRPMERRLAVGVLVVLFLVLNYVFIWPHFSDLGQFAAARR